MRLAKFLSHGVLVSTLAVGLCGCGDGDGSGSGGSANSDAQLDGFSPVRLLSSPKVGQAESSDEVLAVGVGPGGDVYAAGTTMNDLAAENAGDEDLFIARYGADGEEKWVRQYGSPLDDTPSELAVDGSGNLYVVGTGGDLETGDFLPTDMFLTKFDSDGQIVWNQTIGVPEADSGEGLALDDGNLYVVGETAGEVSDTIVDDGPVGSDTVLAKFDTDGNQQWLVQFGSLDGFVVGTDVLVDAAGKVHVVGEGTGQAGNATSNAERDVFWATFDDTGSRESIAFFGTDASEWVNDAAFDGSGTIYVTGQTKGAPADSTNAGNWDAYVLALATDGGAEQWKLLGTPDWNAGAAVVASESNVNLTMWSRVNLEFQTELVQLQPGNLEAEGAVTATVDGIKATSLASRPNGKLILGGVWERDDEHDGLVAWEE